MNPWANFFVGSTGQAQETKPTMDQLESPTSEHASPVSLKRKRESDVPATESDPQSFVPAREQVTQSYVPAREPVSQSYTPARQPVAQQSYTDSSTLPVTQSYSSPDIPDADIPWDQRQYPAPKPPKPYPPPQSQPPSYTHEAACPGLLDYVFQKQNPPNGTKRHHLIQRAQRDSMEPSSRPHSLGNVSSYSVNAYNGVLITTQSTREDDTPISLPPSGQVQQPSWQDYKTAPAPEVVDGSLFDTLPRKKQKQIFSIIGGIQSGIRHARQTAEDLQKQLDILQEALGIGTDDDDES